jgi:hypothetical protein
MMLSRRRPGDDFKSGHHQSSIRAFPAGEKQKIFDTLVKWLGFTVPVE